MSGVNEGLEHIEQVYYDRSWHRRSEVIRDIEKRTDKFYVQVGNNKAWVIVVRPSSGDPYIKTIPDSTGVDNLLSLPRH